MRVTTLILGISMILLGVLSFAFYEQYWGPRNRAEVRIREAKMIFERDTTQATNEALKILTSVWAKYQDFDVANQALLYIARSYERLGMNESALEKYRYLSQQNLGLSEKDKQLISKRIAHIQMLRNRSDAAFSHLYGLLQKSQDSKFRSKVYTELGMLYSKNKNYKKALESLEIANQEDGGNKMALLEKANVLRKLGQDQEVFDIYDRFLAYYSADQEGSKDVLYRYRNQAMRRGLSQFRKGSYWQAIRYFDIVRKKFSSSKEGALAAYWKGESYYRLAEDDRIKETLRRSRFSRALTSYKRFLRQASSNSKADKALFHMGDIYHKMGKNESAITYFNKVIQRNPQGGLAQQAKRWKRKLEEQIYRQGPWGNNNDSVDPTSESNVPHEGGNESPDQKPESSMKLKKDDPFTFDKEDEKDKSPSTSGASSNPQRASSNSGLTEI